MDLFDEPGQRIPLGPGAVLLPGFALPWETAVKDALEDITASSPFRHMQTSRGLELSVAMTSCGQRGWITDRRGYRYVEIDPETGRPWPAMPESWRELARAAAAAGGYENFEPDACLVNAYVPGARMGLHQDRDEADLRQPVVSISFGLEAKFLFGGLARSDRAARLPLRHGDVVVWGGPSRLAFHGVAPLKDGAPTRFGQRRINLTFRRAK
ncbi:MAG: DNA oxidative demethylase AlkB [Steroidobacteraceae bacterium]